MQMPRWMVLTSVCAVFALAGSARAETKVELKSVHLCCGQCEKIVGKILSGVDGVKGACDRPGRTVSITAPDDQAAQKAIDALAEAGFHGDSGNKSLAMKDDSGAKAGKVKTLTVSGIHNCCKQCCVAIKGIVGKVDGVNSDTAQPQKREFEVTGDFDAAAVVKALNAAGFHVKVK